MKPRHTLQRLRLFLTGITMLKHELLPKESGGLLPNVSSLFLYLKCDHNKHYQADNGTKLHFEHRERHITNDGVR